MFKKALKTQESCLFLLHVYNTTVLLSILRRESIDTLSMLVLDTLMKALQFLKY